MHDDADAFSPMNQLRAVRPDTHDSRLHRPAGTAVSDWSSIAAVGYELPLELTEYEICFLSHELDGEGVIRSDGFFRLMCQAFIEMLSFHDVHGSLGALAFAHVRVTSP